MSRGRRPGRWGAAALVAGIAIAAPGSPSQATPADPHIIFHIDVDRIDESSSLAVSTKYHGIAYTTNDSGDGPYIYVLDRSGHLVGTTTLEGVTPVDIEAISAGKDGSLVVADIGDNNGLRDSVPIYRIPQPAAGDHTVTPTKVSLTYSDGPRNAEALAYDPHSGRVIVVSKLLMGARIYTSPPDVFEQSAASLSPVADAPMMSTDATLLPGHHALVVRTYHDAEIYHYPTFTYWQELDLPTQQMGESISGVPGGKAVWAGSEGVDSPVWRVPLPVMGKAARVGQTAPSSAAPPDPVLPAPRPSIASTGPSTGIVLGISTGTVALVGAVGAAGILHRRGRNRDASRRPGG